MKNIEEEKGYCPMCGVVPIIEIGGLLYGERVKYFRCDNCGAEFGIFSVNKEIKEKVIQSTYRELWKYRRDS
jgi:formate dehydrogenase maturation protein FdhE